MFIKWAFLLIFAALAGLGLMAASAPLARSPAIASSQLSSEALAQAIRGQRITLRGRAMEGDVAAAFADGYISAIAHRAAQDGEWCGNAKILPHEIVSRVYEAILHKDSGSNQSREGNSAAEPANLAVRRILGQMLPCPEDQ